MKHFYLAAKYDKRTTVLAVADRIHIAGHIVTARWLFSNQDETTATAEERSLWAEEDFNDINSCTSFVLFNLPEQAPELSAGRHIEYGYAVAKGKELFIVGGGDHIFYDSAKRYRTVESFLHALEDNDAAC